MRNNNYWKNRAKQVEQAAHSYGRDTYASVEKTLRRAHLEIEKQIADWYKRFADNNGVVDMAEARKLLNSKELKELKWDIDDYIKHGQENELDERWMKELENASARYHISRLEALKLRTEQAIEVAFGNELDDIDSMARKVFTESFYHTCYDTMLGLSAGWEIGQVNQSVLNNVVSKPWAVDGKNFSDRIWEQKGKLINEVHQELTRTCVMGEAPDRAIANIAKRFNVSKNQAGRLIMTEQAYFHAAAQKEAFKELDVEQYEIVATLDSHTSDICQDMDGKVFDMKDYEAGVTAPPFHVYCRSVTAPYFDDDFDIVGERAARDENGETYYVPADTTYPEWKEAFVEGGAKTDFTPASVVEQIALLNKYGNLTNLMLNGSSEEMMKWSELQKTTGKNEKELLLEMSKTADNWETILSSQTDASLEVFENQLLDVATDKELGALNLWTGETFANINRYLRYGINVDDISKQAAIDIENVLAKIETPEQLIVHRGTGTKHIFENMVGDWKTDPSVLIGQEFSDAGFTATSPLKEGGFSGVGETQAELFIKVPEGTHGAYIAKQAHNEEEKEFLLQKGYTYRIIKAEYRNNPMFPDEKDLKVWCEVILDE